VVKSGGKDTCLASIKVAKVGEATSSFQYSVHKELHGKLTGFPVAKERGRVYYNVVINRNTFTPSTQRYCC
jgi:hypothetical protein